MFLSHQGFKTLTHIIHVINLDQGNKVVSFFSSNNEAKGIFLELVQNDGNN